VVTAGASHGEGPSSRAVTSLTMVVVALSPPLTGNQRMSGTIQASSGSGK
jgi:hypothetical protein